MILNNMIAVGPFGPLQMVNFQCYYFIMTRNFFIGFDVDNFNIGMIFNALRGRIIAHTIYYIIII